MTAINLWNEAIVDLGAQVSTKLHQDRFRIINRAVNLTASTFSSLLSKHFLTDATVDVVDGKIDLSGIRIMKGGHEISFTLTSDKFPRSVFKPLNLEAFKAWNPNYYQNRNHGAFSYVGNELYVTFGSNVDTTGAITTLWYHRLPDEVEADGDVVDLPEGAPLELTIFKVKRILAERLGAQMQNPKDEARELIQDLYSQVGVIADNRSLEKNVRAFV